MDTERIQSSEVKITSNMINSVRSIKPWTMFLSILGFITVAFMVLAGLFMMVASNFIPQTEGTYISVFMGFLYILFSLLYLFPSIYLFKYSSAIGRFLNSRREIDMESALSYQKSFWKFVGIVCIIMIIISIIGIIAAVVIPLVIGSRALQGS